MDTIAAGRRIGLCLSGGGYRAAAFHLGTLHFLEEIGWLSNVTALSTVSGGTLLGASWALAETQRPEGTSLRDNFDAFAKDFYQRLHEVDLIQVTLDHALAGKAETHDRRATAVSTDRGPRAPRGTSLARCLAEAYQGHFFGSAWLAELDDARRKGSLRSLREVRFNATEFDRGYGFRFALSGEPTPDPIEPGSWVPHSGNWFEALSLDDTRRLRLADVVAASSCFPVLFEPLVFPDHFVWNGPAPTIDGRPGQPRRDSAKPVPGALVRAGRGGGALGLMDGGIFDNQGIEALLNLSDRDVYDVMAISDTDRRPGMLWANDPPTHGLTPGWLPLLARGRPPTLNHLVDGIRGLAYALGAIVAGAGVLGVLALPGLVPPVVSALALVTLAVVAGAIVWGILDLLRAASKLKHELGLPEAVATSAFNVAGGLTVEEAVDLLRGRITSTFAMTLHVFPGRIRRLGYKLAYPKKDRSGGKHRRVSNLIYHLADEVAPPFPPVPDGLGPVDLTTTEELRRVALMATEYPTTLRFDEADQRAGRVGDLVAAGRVTCCFNVMKFLARRHAQGEDTRAEWDDLVERWHAFRGAGTGELVPEPLRGLRAQSPGR